MTAQERREKYTERLASIVKTVFVAENRVNKDPGVMQRFADDSLTLDEYIQLVAEEIASHIKDELIAAFLDEQSADEKNDGLSLENTD